VHSLDLELALALALALEINLALALALDLALALALALEIEIDITLDLDLARVLARALDLDPARALALALDLANNLSMAVGFDYALYYAWATASIFAQARLDRKEPIVSKALASYPTLLTGAANLAQEAGILNLARQLSTLRVPALMTSLQGWQQFADRLWPLLQARNLIQDWQLTEAQITVPRTYFAANELLVQCLRGAVVTDRQAILAGLLSPPAGED